LPRPDDRVMWTLGELGLAYDRIDVGGPFGGLDDGSYRAMNPPGRIPTLIAPSGAALWESKAIIRYLASAHGSEELYPRDLVLRAHAEAWMDWADAFASAVGRIRAAYRSAEASLEGARLACDREAGILGVLEARLLSAPYLTGSVLSVADLAMGVWGHRLMRCPIELGLTRFAGIESWWRRLCERPAFREHVSSVVSARPQHIGTP